MSTLYADRMFVSVNGVEILDVESVNLRVNDGTKAVPTMSRNRRHKGFVKGNRDISMSVVAAVQNALGSPKLESIDYNNQDVAITIESGADRYTMVGVDFVDMGQDASGVGSETKKSFNMVALDIIDQVGNSALFNTSLITING